MLSKTEYLTDEKFFETKAFKKEGVQIFVTPGSLRNYWGFVDSKLYCLENVGLWDKDPEDLLKTAIKTATADALILKKGTTYFILQNGDREIDFVEGGYLTPEVLNTSELKADVKTTTLSFSCLTRFIFEDLSLKALQKTVDWLADGTLKVIDFTEDREKPLSAAQTKKVDKLRSKYDSYNWGITPPSLEYTLMEKTTNEFYWHAPASVLIKDTEDDTYYIFGQDEGTYFGCELPTKPRSVAQAFEMLVPAGIRNIEGVLRQGEWFAVPFDKTCLPPREEWVAELSEDFDNSITLPKEDADENNHSVYSKEGFVTGDGIFVKGFTMFHNEHASIEGDDKTWYIFEKNTAVRSFSQEGVD